MSQIKIQKTEFKSGLTGANQAAFQAVAAKLTGAIAAEQGRKLWGTLTASVHALTHTLGGVEEQQEACRRFFEEVRTATRSAGIAKALADAGYGDWDQLVVAADGKEGLPADAGKRAATLYGAKVRLGKILEKSDTTLKQYENNLQSAIEVGVEFNGVPLSKLMREVKDTRDKIDPTRVEARQNDSDAAGYGQELGSRWKQLHSDSEAMEAMRAFRLILAAWPALSTETREHITETLNLTASIAADALADAKAEAEAEVTAQRSDDAPVLNSIADEAEADEAPRKVA